MRYRPRVTIRELVLLVVIVALAAGWAIEHRRARTEAEHADLAGIAAGITAWRMTYGNHVLDGGCRGAISPPSR